MNIYTWITIAMLLLAVVIANTDKHKKLQFGLAVVLYTLLTAMTLMWWFGV